jgi:putative ABC transport system permease protein
MRWPILLGVLVYQSFILALSQIWASKLRSILTTIGIVIGVASVTGVIAALTGLRTNVLSQFEDFGTNKIFMGPSMPNTGPKSSADWNIIRLHPYEFEGMTDNCPSLKNLTKMTRYTYNVNSSSENVENVSVFGIEPTWHEIERRFITVGRPFSMIDDEQARPVCLINETLQNKLGLDRDPSGQTILIGPRRHVIVGVVENQPTSGMFGNDEAGAEAFVPFSFLYRDRVSMPLWMIAASKSPEVAEEAKAEIVFHMRKVRKLAPDEPNTFQVEYIAQFVEAFKKLSTAVTFIATAIVGVSLVVGGVGIMNIMLVSVSERTREIGLRKAVGAPSAAVLLQFLVEAVVLCTIGGMIGLIIGQVLTTVATKIPGAALEKAYIPLWAVGLSFGFAGLTGVLFGMFPAIKAARLAPIDALRHE